MIFATLSDYIDLTALWKIGVVVLLGERARASLVLHRHRRRGARAKTPPTHQGTSATGCLMLAFGGVVCAAAIALGIWAMLQ